MRYRGDNRSAIQRGNILEFLGNTPSIKGCWSLDGHARDESRNANNGTITGAVPYIGKRQNTLYFDGASKIVVPNTASIAITQAESVTFLAWVEPKEAAPSRYEMIFDKGQLLTGSLRFFCVYNIGLPYQFYFAVVKQSIAQASAVSSIYPHVGRKRFVACTYTGGVTGVNIFIYIDGQLSGTASFANVSTVCDGAFTIGQTWDGALPIKGIIENVAIIKPALTAIEIAQYYQWSIAESRRYVLMSESDYVITGSRRRKMEVAVC